MFRHLVDFLVDFHKMGNYFLQRHNLGYICTLYLRGSGITETFHFYLGKIHNSIYKPYLARTRANSAVVPGMNSACCVHGPVGITLCGVFKGEVFPRPNYSPALYSFS